MSKMASADRFLAKGCQDSYFTFFKHFWPLISEEKLKLNWHIEYLCNELQILSERVFQDRPKEYDLLCNCPPGTSKSSIFSVLWQPWIWTRMPSARFISGSYSERLALDHARKSRDVVTSEKYQRLFPEIKLRDDQNTKGYFINTRGGGRFATGVGGSVTGFHAHFIDIDDPINPLDALSDLVLLEANTWITETLSDRKVDKQITPTAMVMQRLHQNDPTGSWLERGGRIKWLCFPCDNTWKIVPEEAQRYYSKDGLFDAERHPVPVLQEAAARGEAYYAAQYGMEPVPRGGAMFKVDNLVQSIALPSKWKRGPIRFWDKAGSSNKGAFTVGAKGALDFQDRVWIIDIVRGQWDSGTRERIIMDTAARDGKGCVQITEQEPGSGGLESAQGTVKRLLLAGYRAKMIKATGDKELRADPFSVYVNMGLVTLFMAPWNKELIKELRFFPRSTYKDQVDACSGMFTGLTKPRVKIGAVGGYK